MSVTFINDKLKKYHVLKYMKEKKYYPGVDGIYICSYANAIF